MNIASQSGIMIMNTEISAIPVLYMSYYQFCSTWDQLDRFYGIYIPRTNLTHGSGVEHDGMRGIVCEWMN